MPGLPVAGFSSTSRAIDVSVSVCESVPGANDTVIVSAPSATVAVAAVRSGDTATEGRGMASPAESLTVALGAGGDGGDGPEPQAARVTASAADARALPLPPAPISVVTS